MKAYKVWDTEDYEGYQDVVFANNAQEAKKKAFLTDSCSDAEWINVRVNRLPEIDGMQNYTLKELIYELIMIGWWYEFDGIRYDEETIDVLLEKGYVKKRSETD